MAITTIGVFLMTKADTGNTWTKVCDIKSFPALGNTPERLDATTMSHAARVYEAGLGEDEDATFTVNAFKTTEYDSKIKQYIGVERDYAVWFGGTKSEGMITPTGDMLKKQCKAKLYYNEVGGDVNAITDGEITLMLTNPWYYPDEA